MGQVRDAAIATWRKDAGLTEPTPSQSGQIPERFRRLNLSWSPNRIGRMKSLAVELYEVLVREESGIRDGDGYWSGSDPISGIIGELADLNRLSGGVG